jgi:hypothetical protein
MGAGEMEEVLFEAGGETRGGGRVRGRNIER